jgi:hypothetical protein
MEKARHLGLSFERATGLEPATLSFAKKVTGTRIAATS